MYVADQYTFKSESDGILWYDGRFQFLFDIECKINSLNFEYNFNLDEVIKNFDPDILNFDQYKTLRKHLKAFFLNERYSNLKST